LDERGEQPRIAGGRMARVGPLVGMAGRTAGEAVAASLRKRRHPDADLTDFHTKQAQRYAERLGRSRGVLMKAGQMMSLVGLDPAVDAPYRGIYQAAFARLQDDAPPMPPQLAIEVVTAELGRPPEQLFADFDAVPLAAASIGQVHAARLHDGRRVAVKVQYPGVEEAIRADLANTELLATFLQMLLTVAPGLARMDVRAMARELSERIGEEVDYRIEATNQQDFADVHRGHPFIRIPAVIPEFSSRRVLTMELVDGLRYADALRADQSLRDRWGETIFRFVWGNLIGRGLFNADPHPGNYLFHADGTVTFLDFGCVKRFTTKHVRDLMQTSQAALDQDADTLMRIAVSIGMVDPSDPPEAADLLGLYSAVIKPMLAPQPFRYSPDFVGESLRRGGSPRSPYWHVTRRLSAAPDYVFITRIQTGLDSVLGGLYATSYWRGIHDEYWRGGPPATAYGEAEAEHRAARR
jgi:predicted unusual protein kinase regulating ubiquinone biosynthesis (AarF/ABC1/UbiB family)